MTSHLEWIWWRCLNFLSKLSLTFFYLVNGHWIMSLFCAPYLYYNVRLYRRKTYLVDITEVFNVLSWQKKQRLIKLCYLVTNLFLSVFWMIYITIDDQD